MIRHPAVANQFYPGDPGMLSQNLDEIIPSRSTADTQNAICLVSPHAGYFYSGRVAGETFSRVNIPADIVLLGPNHRGWGKPAAIMNDGEWQMPMGSVPVNTALANEIASQSRFIEIDAEAHENEHSLEVQVPFMQYLQKELTLAPICLSYLPFDTCKEIGAAIARAITKYAKPVLIVASTDMSHYESRKSATAKDKLALDEICAMNPAGLYETVIGNRISMCGIIPTTIALIAAKELGATKAELVRYTDSGEASGDTSQVVGYAGFVIA